MAVVIKPVQHFDTQTRFKKKTQLERKTRELKQIELQFAIWIFAIEFLENVDFKLGCFPVLLNVFDNLQSEAVVPVVYTKQTDGSNQQGCLEIEKGSSVENVLDDDETKTSTLFL